MIVIPLQVLANLASVVIGETGPFIKYWVTWNQVLVLRGVVGDGGFASGKGGDDGAGLKVAQENHFTELIIRMDSHVVVKAIKGNRIRSTGGWRLVQAIQRILVANPNFSVMSIFHEGNRCADTLADYVCTIERVILKMQQQPSFLRQQLRRDNLGV
ncbi:hypothetical protein D0Y65_004095 [Glycine soja]|uniref:RNase H type-1 domain-containing protein n=1 Tax=Glycine soja TaxID=3848 RepID=A0A445LPM7_GLYSO|nr:hypothetical protein D0Y65_004095 [Glycine soja]